MKFTDLTLNLPTDYTDKTLKEIISKKLRIKNFTFQIENKSLDARNKNKIHWQVKVKVLSMELKGKDYEPEPTLNINYKKRKEKILIAGSGPAGFFSAYVLQKAGFNTILIERGTDVDKRTQGISDFESTGIFNPQSNYAFGEGGAGTFSDGKLTSRTKGIGKEKNFILSSYVEAGAPHEILYLTHPHLGSDNLKIIVKNLRKKYQELGGSVNFETMLYDIKAKNCKVEKAVTDIGDIEADYYIIAPGHSAYETYRMLMKNNIQFRTKNFAIGSRVEHLQETINFAQLGTKKLKGVKAAEYRLTYKSDKSLPVYTFCMCPGGTVVPAAAYSNTNIVNGMSLYQRDGKFANSACVAGIDLSEIIRREVSAAESLDWLESLELKFYNTVNSYKAPYCSINDFINRKLISNKHETSYPLGLEKLPLWELLPDVVSKSVSQGLKDFCRKLKGFNDGNIMGLESKTSSPIQAVREENNNCAGFKNIYICGEGSGFSGGIISSGVDGIKTALKIIENIK